MQTGATITVAGSHERCEAVVRSFFSTDAKWVHGQLFGDAGRDRLQDATPQERHNSF